MPLLELTNIESHYGHVQALNDVSLHVEQGEIRSKRLRCGQRERSVRNTAHLESFVNEVVAQDVGECFVVFNNKNRCHCYTSYEFTPNEP